MFISFVITAFIIVISIIPIVLVMALGALFIAVFTRPVISVTRDAIRLSGMVEGGIIPIVGFVALGTLPAKMICGLVAIVTGLAVCLTAVVETGRIPVTGVVAA